MAYMGKASTKYLKEAIREAQEREKKAQEHAIERKKKALAVIQEILNEDEAIKNKQHIKRIK